MSEQKSSADTPTILWFGQQQSVGIWDVPEVLDVMEAWLIEHAETYRRLPPHEANALGHLDISCATVEHYGKLRATYSKLRGTV